MDELAYTANYIYREGYDDGYKDNMEKIKKRFTECGMTRDNYIGTGYNRLMENYVRLIWDILEEK